MEAGKRVRGPIAHPYGQCDTPRTGREEGGRAMSAEVPTAALDPCRLVDVRELSRLLGISVRSCWRLSALSEAGQGNGFPRPVKLGPKTVRWRARDVSGYLDSLAGEGPR